MSLFRSTVVIGGLTAMSRVLGFVREILIAAVLGAGPISDAFFAAFRLPNLFRRLLAEGAFNSAFVPLYARRLEGGDPDGPDGETPREAAQRFASETFSVLLVVLFVLVLAAELAMPWLMRGLMPGYADEADWIGQATVLGAVMMPYILFMSLTAMFGGVLNAHGRFAAFAFAPVLLNVVLVGLLLGPIGSEWIAARWLAAGVFAGGVLQCVVVFAGVRRSGIRIRFRVPRLTPGVKRVLWLGLPGAVSAGVTQINIVVSQIIASLQQGAVSWLSYADRLYQLPLGVIGIAMGVALLPTLSKRLQADDLAGARDSLNRAIEISAFFTLPAAVALGAASHFWVQGMFEHGRFTAADTAQTGAVLAAFAVGLPGFIAVKVFAPGYFAREDTASPMRFAGVGVLVNIVVGVALFFQIGVVGLAIGTSVAGYVNSGLLLRGLMKDKLLAPDARLRSRLPRILLAAAVMGGAVWYAAGVVRPMLTGGLVLDILTCLSVGAAGLVLYLVVCFAVGAVRPSDLKSAFRKA